MLSITNKFLFIHVPKTGGNSIQNILRNYFEDDVVVLAKHQDGIERFEVRNKNYDITKHSPLSHYKSIIEPSLYNSLFKFSTIRNPWDMLISYYFSPHRGVKKWNRTSFIDLVENVKNISYYLSLGSQFEIDSELNHLLRFENLDEDFSAICKQIGIPSTTLPRRNISTRKHYSVYYDDELIKVVENKFSEEIKFGGYTFENA